MRDFHVAPAMGAEEEAEVPDKAENPESASDQFRRIAKLAMVSNIADEGVSGPQTGFVAVFLFYAHNIEL